jgi:hypothetical protein
MRTQLICSILFGALAAVFLAAIVASDSFAFDLSIVDGAGAARGTDQATDLFGSAGIFTTVSNVMLFIVGAISVIMVIVGGLRYVISGGNTTNVAAAKNTILYAVVGLVIAIMAYAIINFVIGSFVPGSGYGGTNV